jgi:hypothetical protein
VYITSCSVNRSVNRSVNHISINHTLDKLSIPLVGVPNIAC